MTVPKCPVAAAVGVARRGEKKNNEGKTIVDQSSQIVKRCCTRHGRPFARAAVVVMSRPILQDAATERRNAGAWRAGNFASVTFSGPM
ncbi:hypothetical protein [Bradyrhizobium ivorense]|uniref:hypothetical protein n=1 Tax=Bradyrhizobium ivorense TaxID=2511166 RepID=UPI0011204746|nr:hypothetical protein [Bradyrhizobium ivorense]